MEYMKFESLFKDAGFTERNMKKIRCKAYDLYESHHGRQPATGVQKQSAYKELVELCASRTEEQLRGLMYQTCKATKEQSDNLYIGLKNVA